MLFRSPDPDAPALAEAFRAGTIPEISAHIVALIHGADLSVAKDVAHKSPSISERAIAQVASNPSYRVVSYGPGLLSHEKTRYQI